MKKNYATISGKIVLGLILIAANIFNTNFGFAIGSGNEVIGFNLAIIAFYIAGFWLIYSAIKSWINRKNND